MMRTKDECIAAAARVASAAYIAMYTLPLDEAVRRACRPGGPPAEVVREHITAVRNVAASRRNGQQQAA